MAKSSVIIAWSIITLLTACNPLKEAEWIVIEPAISYQIISADQPKDDIFRVINITGVQNDTSFSLSKDSLWLVNALLSGKTIKSWENILPKGIAGQLKINMDTLVKHLALQEPITINLPIDYTNKRLQQDTIWLKKQPFCSRIHFVSNVELRQRFADANADSSFLEFLDLNLLSESVEFYLNENYISRIKEVNAAIKNRFGDLTILKVPMGQFDLEKLPATVLIDFIV